eukprot:7179645-Prymnesium_polylepis.2
MFELSTSGGGDNAVDGSLAPPAEVMSWAPRVGVYQALREINNKSDGIADDLLPNTQIEYTYREQDYFSNHAAPLGKTSILNDGPC